MTTMQTAKKTTNFLLNRIKEDADEFMDDVLDLDVANHSRVGGDWVTVADMANPDIARNNCWAASNELYENGDFEAYFPVEEVDIVGVTCEGNNHFAVYLANQEEEIVFDVTARQFHPEAPFPLVMPLKMWHAYIEHLLGKEMDICLGDDGIIERIDIVNNKRMNA